MKRGDLAKAEAAARKVERRYSDIIAAGEEPRAIIKRAGAHDLAMAMKLIHRHEKISEREIWARRRARMAF